MDSAHFIGANPPDFELLPVSRTIGENSLVDEFIIRFTHHSDGLDENRGG